MGPPKNHQDATRAERKAKKRKLEDAIPDLPGEETGEVDAVSVEDGKKKGKKRKRDIKEDEAGYVEGGQSKEERKARRKEKKQKDSEEKVELVVENMKADVSEEVGEQAPKKSKKERKAERRAKEAEEKAAAVVATETKDVTTTKGATEQTTEVVEEKKPKKNNRNREKKRKGANSTPVGENGEANTSAPARFIVFIGNLPFSANKASVTKHFASVKPKSVRVATTKEDPTKCKGFGFVEFEGYDHMKTCLKLLHHSMFDDEISPERKINVELTAGGGGNTKERKSKIQSKNLKLNEQRVRRLQEEERAKWEKKSLVQVPADENGIHPSRRAIVPRS